MCKCVLQRVNERLRCFYQRIDHQLASGHVELGFLRFKFTNGSHDTVRRLTLNTSPTIQDAINSGCAKPCLMCDLFCWETGLHGA